LSEEWSDVYDEDAGVKGNLCVKAFTLPSEGGDTSGGGCDAGVASLLAISLIGVFFAVKAVKKVSFGRF
jgi:hypothetical protein